MAADRLADRGGIRLLAPNIRLHTRRRHQPHVVALSGQFVCPGVCPSTGFDANQARWQISEEPDNLRPPQLPLQHHLACGIDTVELEHVLGKIEADCSDRFNLSALHLHTSR